MAQSVIWSQESLDDLDSIAEYISRDSLYIFAFIGDDSKTNNTKRCFCISIHLLVNSYD